MGPKHPQQDNRISILGPMNVETPWTLGPRPRRASVSMLFPEGVYRDDLARSTGDDRAPQITKDEREQHLADSPHDGALPWPRLSEWPLRFLIEQMTFPDKPHILQDRPG